MRELLLVGLGGFVGSIARYGVQVLTGKLNQELHWATVLVNLLGCFLIGLLAGGYLKLSQQQNLLLITGICGGFTTFSTFAFDGLKMLKAGLFWQFALYFFISTAGGLLLCLAGFLITNK